METLYKYDSKGKVREWSIRAEGDTYIVNHGLQGGKIQEKITVCKAKNVGRANETTPVEQALLEAQAKWTFQVVREDCNVDVTKSGLQLRPMLAMDYLKSPHRVDFSRTVSQPKLDGLRLTAGNRWIDKQNHEMMTRKGDTYIVPHLASSTLTLLDIVNLNCDGKCQALDGEAYIHGMSLQNIISLARKYRKEETEKLKYHIFDLIIPDMTFKDRHSLLTESLKGYNDDNFVLVPYHEISNDEEMKARHGLYVKDGYEGLMIRHIDGHYGYAKRSADLFKYKHFFDDEFKIVDVWEDKDGLAMLTIELHDGQLDNLTPKRTHEERKKMIIQKDELIGKWITVKYQAYTDDGHLQFANGMELRECDNEGNPIV